MSQESVLKLLRSGERVSGEDLSRRLGLSRAAVWKAVDALRRDGYQIEARTGVGYRLISAPDALTEREIRNFLGPTRTAGHTILCFPEIDSTNNYLKSLDLQGAEDGTTAVANCQTAGRGRLSRSFQSPPDKGIYLSILLRPELPAEKLLPVTAMTGVAVCTAVEQVCGVRPGLKWPNDPVLGGKKICGILTELSVEGETGHIRCLVAGIGLNVSQTPEDFTPDVAAMATSLTQELGRPVSRPALAASIIEAVDRMYYDLKRGFLSPWLEAFRKDCVNLGRPVRILAPDQPPEQGRRATAIGIDDQFGLRVRYPDGTEDVLRSGEVSVRGLYGYLDD